MNSSLFSRSVVVSQHKLLSRILRCGLLPSNSIQMFSRVTESSLLQQDEYAMQVNPEDVTFLRNTLTPAKKSKLDTSVSLWNHIQSYRQSGYLEKTVLINPETASLIADQIETRSDRGSGTVFVDSDGGLCLVTREVQRRNLFKPPEANVVMERDPSFSVLTDYVQKKYLDQRCKFVKESLVKSVVSHWWNDTDSLTRVLSPNHSTNDWDSDHPNYSLFGTVTHGYLKYLTFRYLYREYINSSEFTFGRPEFFFVLSPRTYLHMKIDRPPQLLYRNVLFKMLFDFEFLAELPRRDFIPWKKTPGKYSSTVTKRYHDLSDTFFLVKVRPKKDIGLTEGVTPHHVNYFVGAMFSSPRNNRIVPLFERWLPGTGLEVVKKGYTIYTTCSELSPPEIIPLMNILGDHPTFKNPNNNFVTQANLFARASEENQEVQLSREAQECYAVMSKDVKVSLGKNGGLGKKKYILPIKPI